MNEPAQSRTSVEDATKRLPSASGYASVEETTDALLQNAITSVNNLSNYLMSVHDDARMYKANQALHKLWEIR